MHVSKRSSYYYVIDHSNKIGDRSKPNPNRRKIIERKRPEPAENGSDCGNTNADEKD